MKSKFLIVIVLVVAAVHVLLFVVTQRETTPPKAVEALSEAPEKREIARPVEPAKAPEKVPAITAEPENADSEQAVADAVSLIQKSSNPIAASAPQKASPPVSESKDPPASDATMVVGLVEGQSKLPPELFAVAEEGAKAVAKQDWETARELYLQLVREAPGNALGYANLGVAEHQLGNLLAASGNLRKSLEINPSIAQNWQTLGIIHYEREELELAISSLTRAIHEDPSDARSRLYLAAVVRSYGWLEASITELERAVETDPQFADAHYNLAVSYLEVTPPKVELARRHYYSAIDLGAESSPEIEAIFRSTDQND